MCLLVSFVFLYENLNLWEWGMLLVSPWCPFSHLGHFLTKWANRLFWMKERACSIYFKLMGNWFTLLNSTSPGLPVSGHEKSLSENRIKQLFLTQVLNASQICRCHSDLLNHSLQGQSPNILGEEVPWVILMLLCLNMIRETFSFASGVTIAHSGTAMGW